MYLVKDYASGFNANMCRSIISLSDRQRDTVEYTVVWSPTITSPDNLNVQAVRLSETHYEHLDYAVAKMKELKPDDDFRIRGMVVGVSSSAAPHDPKSKRSVIVVWNNRPDGGRPVQIIVDLDKDAYFQAIYAHENWKPVEVTGQAKQVGNRWKLFNPEQFEVK